MPVIFPGGGGGTGSVGPAGPPGADGADGTDGIDGVDGADGAVGPAGPGSVAYDHAITNASSASVAAGTHGLTAPLRAEVFRSDGTLLEVPINITGGGTVTMSSF
jgi:hypothetical protein